MAVILLSAAFVLSREGARLVAAQKAATKVVVLDSGHGGDDPGKIGANGVKEKDINLAIARLLKKKLEKQGIHVVKKREGEDDLSDPGSVNAKVQDLQRRVQLIHKKKPDCVISIHQNSYPDAAVKGAQVFYYTDSKEGEKLALCMQAALVAGLDPANHRKAKGNKTYYMLKKTDAVLVICECGFLSNPEEEALLNTKEYQKKVAEGQNDPEHWIYPAYHTGGEGGKVYGMNMDKDYPAFFERTSFETRVAFTKKQYFMPIPYDDLRRIPSLVQNLGW